MNPQKENLGMSTEEWSKLTYQEKNHQLFLSQKSILDKFLKRNAISKAQYDKSLHDLREKKGEA